MYLVDPGQNIVTSGTVTGGNGGRGGTAIYGRGGAGGDGGYGIYLAGPGSTYVIGETGVVSGGDGGAGSIGTLSSFSRSPDGRGGAGVGGANITVINSGNISGGLSGDGVTRAKAVAFGAGDNTFEYRAGSSVTGNVVGDGDDLFRLGGNTDGTFDLALIGSTYQGFGSFEKTGNSTFTLGGTTTQVTPWTISDGVLEILSAGALGADTGLLTFNNPDTALEFTAVLRSYDNLNTARDIRFLGNGAIDMSSGTSAFLSGTFTGGGRFIKTGRGRVVLSGDGSGRTGTTYLDEGTLGIGRSNALGSGDLIVDTGTTLVLNDAVTIANRILLSSDPTSASSTATFQLPSGTATIAGVISGSSANISKTGSGNLTFSGANTYQGTTTVTEGTLTAASNGALGTADGGTIVANGATLNLTNSAAIADALTLSGTGVNGAGALTTTGTGGYAVTGLITLAGDTLIANAENTGLTLGGGVTGVDTDLTFDVNGRSGIDGQFSLGTGAFTKRGDAVLELRTTNSQYGSFTVADGFVIVTTATGLDPDARLTVATGGQLSLSQSNTIGSLAGGGTIVGNDATLTVGNDNTSSTFSGDLTYNASGGGELSLIKVGTGTLTLTGRSRYRGGTTIRGGTIAINGDRALGLGSAVTFDGAGATLGTLATLESARNILLNSGGAFSTAANTTATFSGTISGNGGLTKTGEGTLVLSGANTYGGTTLLQQGWLTVASNTALSTGSVLASPGTTLDYADGVTLANPLAISGTVMLYQDVGGRAEQSGVISGSGAIAKVGAGNLVLSGNNTYSGDTVVTQGTLTVASSGALSDTVGITRVGSSATLAFEAPNLVIGDAIRVGGSGLNGTGALRLESGNTRLDGLVTTFASTNVVVNNGSLIFAGGITGLSNLTLTGTAQNSNARFSSNLNIGAGDLTLNSIDVGMDAANSFTGDVFINSSALDLAANGADTIDNHARVTLTRTDARAPSLNLYQDETIGSLAGTDGYVTANGGNWTLSVGGDNTSTVFDGQFLGSLTLIKTGTGTLSLTRTASFFDPAATGGVTIRGGAIAIRSDRVLGADSAALTFAGGGTTLRTLADITSTRNVVMNQPGTIDTAAGTTATFGGVISGSFSLTKTGAGTLVLAGANTETARIYLNEGTLRIANNDAFSAYGLFAAAGTTIDYADGITNARGIQADAGVVTFNQSGGSATQSGLIADDAAITKTGTGNLTLSRQNFYSGTTRIAEGTLTIANGLALGGLSAGTVVEDGAALAIDGSIVTVGEDISIAGDGVSGNGALRNVSGITDITGLVTLTGASTIASDSILSFESGIAGAHDLTVTGGGITAITSNLDIGDSTLTKNGTGILSLWATNSFTGDVIVNSGQLTVGRASNPGNAIDDAAHLTINGAGLVSFDQDETIGALVGSGDVEARDALRTLTIAGSDSTTFSGRLTENTPSGGVLALTKRGSGNLTLSGDNTYSGVTTVSEGTLTVANGAALGTTAGGTIVQDGATLALDGLNALGFRPYELLGENISLSGSGVGGNGALVNVAGYSILVGEVSLTGATTIGGQAGRIDFSGGVTGTDTDLTLVGESDITFASNFAIGNGSLVINSTGRTVLSTDAGADNDFTGDVTVNAGALEILGRNGASAIGDDALLTINGGTVLLSASERIGALSGSGSLAAWGNRTLTVGNAQSTTFSGSLSENSSTLTLVKTGTGALTLSGANTYSGGTSLEGGTLVLGNGSALGTGTLTASDGTTLRYETDRQAVSNAIVLNGEMGITAYGRALQDGVISGSGGLRINAATILTGANTFSGGTTIESYGVTVRNDAALGTGNVTMGNFASITYADGITLANDLTLNGTALLGGNASYSATQSGTVSGTGTLSLFSTGTLTLTGANTYSGGTEMTEGTLLVGNGSALGTGALSAMGGTLGFAAADLRLANAINMPFAFTVDTSRNSGTLSGVVSGNGTLTKTGSGALTLTGANTFTGGTNVQSGTLYVNGDQSGATGGISVADGATLGGDGIIGGDVTLADGASLNPGTSPGTLTINGSLSLSGGSILNFEFGEAGVAGGALNDLVNVGGDLVLDGTLNVSTSAGGTFGAGVYRVFNYSGTLTDNGLALGTVPGGDVFVQTAVAGQVNLINATGDTFSFWDGAAGADNNIVDGGDGTWMSGAGNRNWTNANGSLNLVFADGTFAIFQGTPGTVSIYTGLGPVRASGLQFVTDGYTIDGDVLTLNGGAQSTIRVGDGTAAGANTTATIAASLTGATQLVKTDLGTLVLSGDNTYTGGTRLNDGALVLASENALGTGALVTSDGTSVTLADGVSIGNAITLDGAVAFGTEQLPSGALGSATISGTISGSGSLNRTGGGSLTLSGANTYSGGTVLRGFTTITNSSALGTGTIITDGGVLTFGADNLVLANDIDLANGGNFSHSGYTVTLRGTVTGAGGLSLPGTGTAILTGANTHSGGTFINGGTLVLANDSALGTGELRLGGGAVAFADGVTIANDFRALSEFTLVQESGTATHSGVISGSTRFTKTGSGTLVLAGANTIDRGMTLFEGTLILANDSALGTGTLTAQDGTGIGFAGDRTIGNAIALGGLVTFDTGTASVKQSGSISGGVSGSLVKIGSGNLTLTGANSYAGTTTVEAGTLTVGSGNALGSTAGGTVVRAGATLAIDTLVTSENISIAGGGVDGTGALIGGGVLNGTVTLTDAAAIASAAGRGLTFTGAIEGTDTDLVFNGPGSTTISGGIATGAGDVSIDADGGTVSFLAGNSFAGDLTMVSGTLEINASGASTIGDTARILGQGGTINLAQDETVGSIAGSGLTIAGIFRSQTLTTGDDDRSTTFSGTLAEALGGTLALTKVGTGALTLTGNNTYTGTTNVLAGTLYVNGDQSGATGLTSVADGATLGGNGIIGGDVTLADGASLNPGTSPGTLTINGNLSLSGGSILNFEFGEAGGAGGALNDLVNVGGDLVLDGTLNVTTSLGGTFGAGVYRVFNYSGTLTDNGLELGTMPGSDVVLQTSVANQVNLVNTASASLSFWDGASGANNGTIDGGAGLWQSGAGNSNWTDANGTVNGAYDAGTFAIFQGTGGIVTVDTSLGAVAASGMQFVTDGYVIDGDTLTLAGGAEATIRVGDGTAGGAEVTATIAADITGTAQLIKTDLGTLVLSGDNNYTGGTRLDMGTLVLGSNNALGTGLLTTAGDTTLGLADGVSIANVIVLGGDTMIDLAGTSTLSGVISGTGALIRTGNGTLTLTGANTYTGATVVLGGTLALGEDDVLSDETIVTVRGATLDLLGNSDTVAAFQLVDGMLAGSGTLTSAEYQLEDGQVDANLGAGTLFQTGGTSVLGGTSAAEIVAIDAGSLRLGANERLADGASVRVAEEATFDLAGVTETIAALYGMGAIDLGAGELTLGGTGLDSGFGGTLTGSGTLSKTGSGVFTLLGDHSGWTGTLEVLGGTLQFTGSSEGSALISGGMLSGNSTFASALTMSGGTISPGVADAPIGTISAQTINLTGGTALFDFRSPEFGGLSDMLVASGAISISGTEVVVSSADPRSSFPDVHRYTIVQGGSLTGTFANGDTFQQMDSDPHLFWRLRYDLVENGVALEVRRTVDFGANLTPGTTPNQIAVAATLSNGQLEVGDAFSDAILPLGNLPEADQLRAFDSMGGESLTSATTGAFIEGQRFADLLTQRIYGQALVTSDAQAPAQARALAPIRPGEADALAAPDIASFSMWMQAFGGDARIDGDAATRNLRSDASGFAGGIEVRYGLFKAGIAGGYSDGSYDVRSLQASMQGESVHVGGYLGYEGEAAFAGLFGSYQRSDFDSTRLVTPANTGPLRATADIDMTGRTFGGFAGYRARLAGGLVLAPMAGVTNIRIERDSFDEIGADPLNLLVSDETREVTYASAQLRLSTTTKLGGGTFEPYLAGGAERYWGDLRAVSEMRFAGAAGDMGSFRIIGAPLEEMIGVVGAGFDVRPNDRFEIGASAGARVGERTTQATVEMHARIRF